MVDRARWSTFVRVALTFPIFMIVFAFALYWSINNWIVYRRTNADARNWTERRCILIDSRVEKNPYGISRLTRVALKVKAAEPLEQFATAHGEVDLYEPFNGMYTYEEAAAKASRKHLRAVFRAPGGAPCFQSLPGRKMGRLELPTFSLTSPVIATVLSVLLGAAVAWMSVVLVRAGRDARSHLPQTRRTRGVFFLRGMPTSSLSHLHIGQPQPLLTTAKVDELLRDVRAPDDVCVICLEEFGAAGGSRRGSLGSEAEARGKAAAVAAAGGGTGSGGDVEAHGDGDGDGDGGGAERCASESRLRAQSSARAATALSARELRPVAMQCRHVFHYHCIKGWLLMRSEVRCPLCNHVALTTANDGEDAELPTDCRLPRGTEPTAPAETV